MKDSVIYHCGPVVATNEDGSYDFVAAGPTTSIREEPYQADVIGRYGLRGVIGKGGMGAKTLAGLAEHGAVYLHAVGGAAQVLARAIPRVERVFMLEEFGVPEALWVIEVDRFPVIVLIAFLPQHFVQVVYLVEQEFQGVEVNVIVGHRSRVCWNE